VALTAVCTIAKEMPMNRFVVSVVLVMLCVGLRSVPHAVASREAPESVQPRMIATILALTPQGMATIRDADGTLHAVVKGTTWHVGDTVVCEHRDSMGLPPWQMLDCRKIS